MMQPTERHALTIHCVGEIDQDAPGPEFFDESTGREGKLIVEGEHAGWLVFWGESDRWLPWRRATRDDLLRIQGEVTDRIHGRLT